MNRSLTLFFIFSLTLFVASCGDDDDENEANKLGVGAECTGDDACTEEGQSCLSFKGGYCGVQDCMADADCPTGSACVTHDDGENYCFLVCSDKSQCNANRSAANEANCSSSVTLIDGDDKRKACVPPS